MPKRLEWTAEIDAAIRDHYPAGGALSVVKACPGAFTEEQIRQRAKRLGIRVSEATRRKQRRRWGGGSIA